MILPVSVCKSIPSYTRPNKMRILIRLFTCVLSNSLQMVSSLIVSKRYSSSKGDPSFTARLRFIFGFLFLRLCLLVWLKFDELPLELPLRELKLLEALETDRLSESNSKSPPAYRSSGIDRFICYTIFKRRILLPKFSRIVVSLVRIRSTVINNTGFTWDWIRSILFWLIPQTMTAFSKQFPLR